MKKLVVAAFVAASLAAVAVTAEDWAPEPPQPQHAWLQQLVGEWECEFTADMGPGQPAMTAKGTEVVRAIGAYWIVGEGKAELMGMPMESRLTLGYDPRQKAFVGTWIDSVQTHMWRYTGATDAAGKVLTLDTEGPDMQDPTRTAKYRETLEVKDKDHKTLSSAVLGEDGKWTTFMTANYVRKK